MLKLESYANKYQTIQMSRTDGILEVKLHTNGGPLHWSLLPHGELTRAFHEIGQDYENEVIILTGTGAAFSGPALGPNGHNHVSHPVTAMEWDKIYFEGKHLLLNLLNIEVPIIAAINGPTLRHAEIPLLSDIVLAADTATFQDSAHFWGGLVPGDGVHIVFPHLMGTNRGRYFLLTGQTINAQDKTAHVDVNEIISKMPAMLDAQKQLEKLSATYDAEYKTMAEEYTNKMKKYEQEANTVGDAVNQTRQAEMQDLVKRITDYRDNAQKELQKKESDLVKPLMDKIKASIQKVGKAKGYQYVLNVADLLLSDGPDLTADIKKDLGF